MRRRSGRNKDYSFQPAFFQGRLGQTQMAIVDRIEGPAEKSDSYGQLRTCPCPKTTNLRVVSSSNPIGP